MSSYKKNKKQLLQIRIKVKVMSIKGWLHAPLNSRPGIVLLVAQLAEAVKYTDFFSAEGTTTRYECPTGDTKQYHSEVQIMLELWENQSTLLFPSLPSQLSPGVVAPGRFLSLGQIELNFVLMLN